MSTFIPTETLPPMNPQGVVTTQQFHPTSCMPSLPASLIQWNVHLYTCKWSSYLNAGIYAIPPPPVKTPPKLRAVEEVMKITQGQMLHASLRRLATELQHSSLGRKKRNKTEILFICLNLVNFCFLLILSYCMSTT